MKKKNFSKATCHNIYSSKPDSAFVNKKSLKFDKILGSFVCLFLHYPEVLFCGVASFI